eukprot:c45546_g1_i1.p1 GENE.c45546_g1_i1~~c45546_g1_i1.p1  ORF type:complete len:172 (+),score=26.21 c45546_g1_i1:53-568(+)
MFSSRLWETALGPTLSKLIYQIIDFVAENGWFILAGLLVAYYLISNYVRPFVYKVSTKSAVPDPTADRLKMYDEQRRLATLRRQEELKIANEITRQQEEERAQKRRLEMEAKYKNVFEHGHQLGSSDEPADPTPIPFARGSQPSSSSRRGGNPLSGFPSTSSFRPSRPQRG